MGVCAMLQSLVSGHLNFTLVPLSAGAPFSVLMWCILIISDDGKLQAESDSGEFWVLFGGFAPIGKKAVSDDDVVLATTAPKLYRYFLLLKCFYLIFNDSNTPKGNN